ncbi:MAG: hypothetical protein ABW106_02145 [Steroidobacteraceae bacterium]
MPGTARMGDFDGPTSDREERVEQNTSKVFEETATPLVTSNGAGSPLFIINLCASMAPIAVPGKTLPGFDSYRLYQVARAEDGRTRHRLRLGFFVDEAEASKTLAEVRAQYPTAFMACLADEDKKFTRGFVTEPAPAPAAPKPQISVVIDNDSTRPQMRALRLTPSGEPAPAIEEAPTAVTPPAAAKPDIESSAIVEVSWEPEKPAVTTAAKPATTAKTVAPTTEIEVSWEPVAAPKQAPAPTAAAPKPQAPIAKPQQPPVTAKAQAPAVAPPKVPAAPAKAAALDLAATGSFQSTAATGQHRGMVKPPAPVLDPLHELDLALAAESTAPAQAKKQPAITGPLHIGKGVSVPDTDLTLATTQRTKALSVPAAASAAPVAPAARSVPATPASREAVTAKASHISVELAEITPPPRGDLDSTQTIRALTEAELKDESQEKWFAIQLAISEQPVNLDTMPHLDIFEAYRLYSLATAGSGKITHSLRLGFFREAVSAEAVSGYVKTFFPTPTIVRISVAEHARFKDRPEPAEAVETPQESNVVALSDARARNAKQPVIPTITMEVDPPLTLESSGSFKPNATGSFRTAATGSFKPGATGAFKAAAGATGKHKAIKTAAKGAVPAVKHSPAGAANRKASSATGKHPIISKKRLTQELMDEAREVELEESGIRQLQKGGSLLSRLVNKLSK